MKLFLWTNKLLFLIPHFFILASVFVIRNFNDLSLNRSGKSYYELINVCNLSLHGFLIVPSREFHGPLELSSPMKYMLGCNCLFRGHEMYRLWSACDYSNSKSEDLCIAVSIVLSTNSGTFLPVFVKSLLLTSAVMEYIRCRLNDRES